MAVSLQSAIVGQHNTEAHPLLCSIMAIALNSHSGAIPCTEVISATKVSFFGLLMSRFVIGGFHTGSFGTRCPVSVCVRMCLG